MSRKNVIACVLAFALVAACSGEVDDSGTVDDGTVDDGSGELYTGQSLEALLGSCAGTNHWGIDGSNVDWLKEPCDINKPTADCTFPRFLLPSPLQTSFWPYNIRLGTGWSGIERSDIGSIGAAAATFMNGQMGGDCTNLSGQTASTFGIRTDNATGNYFVTLDKGTLPEFVNPTNDSQPFQNFVHLACVTAGATLSESSPMARAQICMQYRATVDYTKLMTWANTCGSACTNRALRNMLKKVYSIGMGVGLNHVNPATSNVDNNSISRTVDQTTWSGNQVAWVCNSARAQDQSNQLRCQ